MVGQCLTSFQHKLLLKELNKDGLSDDYQQRIEIMLLADAGRSQSQICEALGCAQETARYWMSMAKAGQAHKWRDRPIGRPKKVTDRYLQRLQELVRQSPKTFGYAFERWTGQWLSKHLAKELNIEISSCHVSRLLNQMNLSTRPATDKNISPKDSASAKLSIRDLSPYKNARNG